MIALFLYAGLSSFSDRCCLNCREAALGWGFVDIFYTKLTNKENMATDWFFELKVRMCHFLLVHRVVQSEWCLCELRG